MLIALRKYIIKNKLKDLTSSEIKMVKASMKIKFRMKKKIKKIIIVKKKQILIKMN